LFKGRNKIKAGYTEVHREQQRGTEVNRIIVETPMACPYYGV
jgi:hypothetical protein